MVGQFATEAYQATYYKQMLQLLSCDPNVRVINIFHLVDEPNLAGWQSGLYWVGTARPSRSSRRRCRGAGWPRPAARARGSPCPWKPARAPLQAAAKNRFDNRTGVR